MKKAKFNNFISSTEEIRESKSQSILLLLSVCTGAFLSHFSAGFVNIALSDIAIDYATNLTTTQWIVNGYLLSIMLLLPLMGKLSDQYGKKKIHNLGYLFFAAGACASAISPNILFLIVARILQGSGAAMLQAVNMAIVTDAYPKEHRGKALGIISTSVGIGALLGPSVGGFVMEYSSWHLLFWTVVPISVGAYFLAQKYIPKDKTFQSSTLDVMGSLLFGIATVSFVFVLNTIGKGELHFYLIILMLISLSSFICFFFHTKRVQNPFIEPTIFVSSIVRAGGLILIVSYGATFASTVILPFYLRGVLGYSAEEAGLLLMCYPLFLAIVGPISGSLSDRYGGVKVVFGGVGILSLTMLALSFLTAHTSLFMLLFLFSLLGFAMGLLTSPNYSIMMLYTPVAYLGMMSSTIALLRNIGMIIGTALAISFMNAWLEGTISQWMQHTSSAEVNAALLGFHYLFLLLSFLLLLVGVYFFFTLHRSKEGK
ncbi:MFS transporter [Bacillus sp. B1-b2]|uniref:MFS transporter n=1 Tax=Bacillus sp. B1-b2 TaxID=2653201 RepID=UPI001261CD57|nr:MFS transporter [Bacillus sp. B1-b2]KAB7665178.1 MFS transporter [Bacillus sp. B1-b2]